MKDFDKSALDALAVGKGNEFMAHHLDAVFLDLKVIKSVAKVKDKFCCSIGAALIESKTAIDNDNKQEQGSD